MSTVFNNVYDEFRTKIASALSTRTEINNPYNPEDEADRLLKNAYAIGVGSGENSNRAICGIASMRRQMTVTLFDRFYAPSKDITQRISAEKALVNAQQDLIKASEQIPNTTNIVNVRYVSDSGIEFLPTKEWGFLFMQVVFSIEYIETF